MDDRDHYSAFLMKGPHAFAHHKVIADQEGKPVDYVFLEVNEAFERLTGLKAKDIINKKVTEAIPGIEKNEFNWIEFFGNVGLTGVEEEYEQFSAPLNRWYKGYAYSSRKGYFTTMFTDITPDRLISEASRKFMEYTPETLDYNYIADTMLAISGAAFVVLNRFEPDGKDFTTLAIAGHSKSIGDAAKILGFGLPGKKWKHDPQRESKIKSAKTTRFTGLSELVGKVIPKKLIQVIERTFKTGECAIVKTSKGKTIIGDFTLIYQKGQKIRNQAQLEIYADIVGMLFSRLEAESGIKMHKEELKLLSDNIGTQLWYLKNVHTYGAVNKAHADFMGCRKSDLEHQDLYDLVSKEEADICVQGNKTVFEEKQVVVTDEWIVNGAGEKRLLHITKNPKLDKNGKVEYVVCKAEDITERKQAEEEIKKAREQYQSLVENIPGVTYRCKFDKDWTMLFMSEAVDPLSGYPASDFINNAIRSYESIIHPEDSEMVSQGIQAAVTEKMAWDIDYRLFNKNGNIRWVQEKGRAVFDEDGSVAYLDGFILDISEKKEAELFKQFQLEFQQIVAEASSRFVGIESDEAFDDVLNDCLLRLGKLFGVDRSYLFMFSDDLERMSNTHEWCATGISSQMNRIQDAATDTMPWWRKQIMQAKTVHVPEVNALPPEAKAEKEEFSSQGIQSLISLPMQSASGNMMGFFGFDAVNKPYRWPREQIVMLQLVADTIGGAIERRRFHQSIVEKNTQLRQIMDLVPGYIFAKDIDGRFLLANKAVADVFGTSTDEIAGKTDKDYGATDEQMEAYSRDDREVIESGRPKLIPEEQIIRKDGSLGWFQTVKIPYKHPGWDKPAILGVGTDITERKQAEEKILENEQRFNLAISGTGAGLWDWDMVKDTVYFSPYWKEMLGYEDHEVENDFMGWKNLWHPDDAGKIEQAISDHLAGKTKKYEIEHRLKHKDGSWRWILTRGDIIKDKNGTPLRWVGTNIDLTENKKLSLEVERQSSLISSLLDSIPDIIFFKDKDGVYLGCNPPFAEFVGRPREEIVGRTDYDLFSKEIADFFRKHDKKMLELMEQRHNEEWITYPDGRTILIDTLKTPYYGPGGKLIGILGISRDITDRKKAEEAIIQAREQAQAASKAKSEFLANMSHEIRTPLNGVIGFTDLLKNTQLTKLQQQYLDNANTSAHMLLGIISDILDLSKIESGKLELDPVKTDLIELTAQAIDIVKYKASEKGLEMLLNIQPGMPRFAEVDPIRLKQVLVNLLGNAVKFTEKGEVEFKVEFSETNKQRGSFHFSVRDTGIGIEKSKKKKLFDPFYQADASTTRRFGGAGLGLQISKLLIDKMKGNIGVESEYGKGSTFSFDIETKYEAGEKADKQSLKDIKHVLVVDDNDNNRMILQHTLENWGIACTCSDSGLSALQLIRDAETAFDVIIVDYHMPVFDGLETIRMIRQNLAIDAEKQPVILLYSSADDSRVQEECKALDVCFKLVKPVKSDELFYYLQHIHDKTELIEEMQEQEEVAAEDVFSGIKPPVILLAEDVKLNMELIKSVLQGILPHAQVLEAVNGKEAVDFVAREAKIDLVFMDVQMPVMDGLEATRRIRALEKELGKSIPIIALTAGVVKGEKEKCLDAGMDDFLAKPLNQLALRELVKKHLHSEPADAEQAENSTVNPDAHFDLAGLMDRTGADHASLVELLNGALFSIEQYLDQQQAAIDKPDPEELSRIAHTIKGISLNMGFMHMSDFALRAEQLEVGDLEKLSALRDDMRKELSLLKSIVKQYSRRAGRQFGI